MRGDGVVLTDALANGIAVAEANIVDVKDALPALLSSEARVAAPVERCQLGHRRAVLPDVDRLLRGHDDMELCHRDERWKDVDVL